MLSGSQVEFTHSRLARHNCGLHLLHHILEQVGHGLPNFVEQNSSLVASHGNLPHNLAKPNLKLGKLVPNDLRPVVVVYVGLKICFSECLR